jgi:outer membrane protein assembly factor BamB
VSWHLTSACLLAGCLGGTLTSAAPAPPPSPPGVRWQLPVPGWGEPAADDSAAYFLTRTHEVLSIDGATGTIRWRSATGGTGDVPSGTQVRLTKARVLVGDGGIVAFDRISGRRTWRFDAPDGDDAGVFLGAADADMVVAGSPAGRVYAIDAVSGALRWLQDVADGQRRVAFPPVHAGGAIVASFTTFDGPLSGGLVGFDRAGRRRWTHRFDDGAGAAGPPVVVGGVVVIARTDGRIEAIASTTGRRLWGLASEAPSPAGAHGRDIRALASEAGILVVTSLRGPVRAFDVRRRRQRWAYADNPTDAVVLRVRAFGDRLYLPYSDGSLVALDLRTGQECWRAASRHSFDWPPAVTPAAVFASGAATLWALQAHPVEPTARPELVSDNR